MVVGDIIQAFEAEGQQAPGAHGQISNICILVSHPATSQEPLAALPGGPSGPPPIIHEKIANQLFFSSERPAWEFNYIRPYDIPDALIGIVASPIAYSKWIEYLKLHKIGIYFRGAEVFQPLPEAPATGSAAMNEADDGPDLTPEAENKDVAPAPS